MNCELPMRPAGYAISETAAASRGRRRKSRLTAESTGKRLVLAELLRRGFEAEFAGARYEKHDMLVWVSGSPPQPIQIKTVHSPPWYVRRASLTKLADQVTVYVLLGAEISTPPARFFVVRNGDLADHFRQPPTWQAFGFIDAKSVGTYEDNWEILR